MLSEVVSDRVSKWRANKTRGTQPKQHGRREREDKQCARQRFSRRGSNDITGAETAGPSVRGRSHLTTTLQFTRHTLRSLWVCGAGGGPARGCSERWSVPPARPVDVLLSVGVLDTWPPGYKLAELLSAGLQPWNTRLQCGTARLIPLSRFISCVFAVSDHTYHV